MSLERNNKSKHLLGIMDVLRSIFIFINSNQEFQPSTFTTLGIIHLVRIEQYFPKN